MASKYLKLSTDIPSSSGKEKSSSSTTKNHQKLDVCKFKEHSRARIIENFVVVWLDAGITESSKDCQNSITRIRFIVNAINTFTDPDECVGFLAKINDEKVFMIVSGGLGQQFVPLIEHMIQLDSIYVFCGHKAKHEVWVKKFKKVKGVFTDIESICNLLRKDMKKCDNDMIAISIISTVKSSESASDRLDQSFMYSQLLKENLLQIDHSIEEKKELLDFCYIQYAGNSVELNVIGEFDRA
ncbi:unnamed protein product [Rotaria magnacalcarata]|uniref:Uncharacterized protein n=2 Tax=Rotaria magnacalcarata TaxID=392030 RepID=A0A816NN56_9BILA|nr:unnamed protein product [Rotaria magnacalcarata]